MRAERTRLRKPYTVIMSPRPENTSLHGSPELASRAWFVRVRAFAAVLAMAVLLAVEFSGDWQLPTVRVLFLLAFMLLSNLPLWARVERGRNLPDGVVAAVLVLDILLLTLVLALTGGASNPFSSAYILYVTVAALLLTPGWTTSVVVAAVTAFSGLFWLDQSSAHAGHHSMRLHLMGMWVAFVVVGPVVAFAITRLRNDATVAARELEKARRSQQRAEKLGALATLSAGAAHELSTPLGTIAVIARDLERRNLDPELTTDAGLIREEIERCSKILSQLAVDVGSGIGEAPQSIRLDDLVTDVIAEAAGVRLTADAAVLARSITLPRRLTTQALHGLVRNARQASPDGRDVHIRLSDEDDRLLLEVADQGCGMNAEVMNRAGEPFFTTKTTGEGMGLGIFFARSVTEHLGGELQISSEQGRGTTVAVRIPWTTQH